MKKKIITAIVIVVVLVVSFLIGTGFMKNPTVILGNYSISEDGSELTLYTGIPGSVGYIRGFKNNGGGVKPHYLTFYYTFGGFNSSFGSKNVFTTELAPDDNEIYFNRADGGYELVLVKDDKTGQWVRPSELNNQQEIITYNGKEYKKSELCDATLQWLELSEEERKLSSYLPSELRSTMKDWGVSLSAENITPTSATIKCIQSGGEPTSELQTGSRYIIEIWTKENGWQEAPYLAEVYWTDEALLIKKEDVTRWAINWEWLYGKLAEGKYRIGKEITDFRATGDYDTEIYYAEFEIVE